ncbi:hypothetical protein RPB_3406 [Rhodopseudomonas palustris HaA2]|uniref:PepSY domain-containing protein n=1 Tax=Rhodopseudomonas palustris (strain HaA2) TaxID=316058 RepID=Q2IUK8_RHOP2|nr:hypothetical protein [Rhodopseudomonas palustris]ABD08102.1 hypothetical protein RPB_3406 [Rhodopseudomonas palustris HaA2]
MSVRIVLSTLTAASLLLGLTSAVQSAREPRALDAGATEEATDETGSLPLAAGSGADLVRMVESSLTGARVYDLSFNGDGAAPSFEVKSYRDDNIWKTVVDAATRRIVRSAVVMPASDLHAEDKRGIDDFKRSSMALADAIAIAEKYGPGKAISAGLHHADGKLVFVVVVVSNGGLKEIVIRSDGKKRGERRKMEQRPDDSVRRMPG